MRWQIREVRPGVGFIIDIPLDGAVVSSEWWFDAVSSHRTRITQRIVLWGTNAKAYVNDVHAGFRLDPRRRHEEDRRRHGEGTSALRASSTLE